MNTATATTAPAYLCWSMSNGYFVQIGGTTPRFYGRDCKELPLDAVTFRGYQQYRVVDELGMVSRLEDAVSVINARYPNVGYDHIMLANNEWGNELMQQVTREHFDANPDCQFVEVYEHAGWYLCFRRDLSIWGTANDQAVLRQLFPRPAQGINHCIRR